MDEVTDIRLTHLEDSVQEIKDETEARRCPQEGCRFIEWKDSRASATETTSLKRTVKAALLANRLTVLSLVVFALLQLAELIKG